LQCKVQVFANRAQVFSAISMSAGSVIDILRGKRQFVHFRQRVLDAMEAPEAIEYADSAPELPCWSETEATAGAIR
jgi:hypothetical protein